MESIGIHRNFLRNTNTFEQLNRVCLWGEYIGIQRNSWEFPEEYQHFRTTEQGLSVGEYIGLHRNFLRNTNTFDQLNRVCLWGNTSESIGIHRNFLWNTNTFEQLSRVCLWGNTQESIVIHRNFLRNTNTFEKMNARLSLLSHCYSPPPCPARPVSPQHECQAGNMNAKLSIMSTEHEKVA